MNDLTATKSPLNNADYIPKLSFRLTLEQQQQMINIFPRGLQRVFFSAIVDWIIVQFHVNGRKFLSEIILDSERLTKELEPFLYGGKALHDPYDMLISNLASELELRDYNNPTKTLREILNYVRTKNGK